MLKIYSKIYNCFANELLLVLKEIYSDYQKDYSGLANYKMKCSKNKFANNHINSIKNLQRYSKCRLSKFKWIKRILLHLKKREFIYNNSKNTKNSIVLC